ncbi:EAL domain-containing protein [Mangrovimicrobium sediminis]|uniref:EAL domain-containing protein n=1 Tax=Mangrovimicrobium sediminis TaxID=2562682 RepID=A0A4Z0M5V5_9GAMM|nr:EAL domain-containing protein [Haliea sp. SAOS-164]TGD74826.1 EAL domain-containing protein [Haliea sp. SAOS-164]
MGWSPADISLLAVEVLAALALLVLWLGDRQRSYTLWWAISHLTLPVPALLIALASGQDNPSLPVAFALCVVLATQSASLMAGVISYRTGRFRLRPHHVLLAIAGLSAFFFSAYLFAGNIGARLVMVGAMALALMASAALMWSLGPFERIAAGCFALRGSLEIGLLAMTVLGQHHSTWFTHFLGFNGLIAISTILALLIAAYQRSLQRLRAQYRFLELSQEMAGQLQGLSDESSLAERALNVIVTRLDWQHGLFFRPVDASMSELVPLAQLGHSMQRQARIGHPMRPPQDGLISLALHSRKVCHSAALRDDPRASPSYKTHPLVEINPSMVVIPVTHDDQVLGVILLRDNRYRELPAEELRTLESLGQVIGVNVANARNLNELAHRANHDTLTGLGNRAALHDYLGAGTHLSCAVMLFDLDRFKQVNDALGHAVGDKLLRAMADRLGNYLVSFPARLFRLGGDEFVIIHALEKEASQEDALQLARDLAEVISQPIEVGELSLRMSASIGVALAPAHGDNSHELLRCADVAMYYAKQRGTGVALYRRDIDAYKLEDLTLLAAVSEGLEQDQFVLFYQPIIAIDSGDIVACEALIRWYHPVRGLIEAKDFLPLIETTDLIRELTHRVVETAMADMQRLRARGIDFRVSLNLSARNILDPALPAFVAETAQRFGIDPSTVQLEITETILIKDPSSAGKVLSALAEAGFTLALDDFGTGYSSMAYLARFPIHMLKIDRSFVHAMLHHAQSRAIVETTIALARGLGLEVTAEGVEHDGEADLLRNLGCDYAQGYLIGRPMPESELLSRWWPQDRASTR